MDSATMMSRLQFAFTASYHYLFPQITMGLALLILILKTIAVWRNDERYLQATRFWTKIFAVTFIMGVVTGIPMEFQFGTNWALFSTFAGNIIAQLLAMEGAFAFFLESAFVGLLLFGERRFGQKVHWFAALMVFIGTWASGYFIIAADAWVQHPVGYTSLPDGNIKISDYWAVVFNSWIGPMYLHTMSGAVITGAFVMTGLGAYYLLLKRHVDYGRIFLTVGVIVGLVATLFQLFPSGDFEGRQVASYQPTKLAAMEGLYNTTNGAGVVILGQPDTEKQSMDNAIEVPRVLSFLTYRHWSAKVLGLNAFPRQNWPDNIPLLYYSYHIMSGLGTIFIAVMVIAALLLWRRKLYQSRWMLWILMLVAPFPFIANTTGWLTTELGRQPWLAYNLLRTADGVSTTVSSGNVLFTLLGFAGMYLIMGILYVVLMFQEIIHGPEAREDEASDIMPSMVG